jgi:hypothetical protein
MQKLFFAQPLASGDADADFVLFGAGGIVGGFKMACDVRVQGKYRWRCRLRVADKCRSLFGFLALYVAPPINGTTEFWRLSPFEPFHIHKNSFCAVNCTRGLFPPSNLCATAKTGNTETNEKCK